MSCFFSSDWHLGHKNIIAFSSRPFENVEDMTATIIGNTLNVMQSGDTLYLLGDMGFNKTHILDAFKQLKLAGIHIVWVLGNHDRGVVTTEMYSYCDEITHMASVNVRRYPQIQLCHFPMVVWAGSVHNSWHLHGHVHATTADREYVESTLIGKALNVNVEMHNFTPWSLLEVKEYMDSRPDNVDYTLAQARKLKDKIST